jgi:hypothetical protein
LKTKEEEKKRSNSRFFCFDEVGYYSNYSRHSLPEVHNLITPEPEAKQESEYPSEDDGMLLAFWNALQARAP